MLDKYLTRWVTKLRQRYPALGKRVDHGNSRTKAIKLMCLACEENRAGVTHCLDRCCPLYTYRPLFGRLTKAERAELHRPSLDHVPSVEEYDEALSARASGNADGLRRWRESQGGSGFATENEAPDGIDDEDLDDSPPEACPF